MKNEITKSLKEIIQSVTRCEMQQKQDFFSSPSCIPSSTKGFQQELQGESGVNLVDDYLIRHDQDFMEKHADYTSLNENGYFNPHKPYKLSEFYIKPANFENLNIIHDFFDKPKIKRNIVLIGEKGSGKTAGQNIWLNENNGLLEDKHVFWVRCDGHKLYDLWLNYHDYISKNIGSSDEEALNRLVTIDEYLDIQLLYVFAKYAQCKKRAFITTILKMLKTNKYSFNFPDSRKNAKHFSKKFLYDEIKIIEEKIVKDEINKAPEYSHALDDVMRISLGREGLYKRQWLAISQALQFFLEKNGCQLLKIVDGIDNVHINEDKSKVFYQCMINNVARFLKYKPRKNSVHLLVMRERTYIEASNYPIQQDPKDFIKDYKIRLSPSPKFKEIISRRYDYAVNKIFIGEEIYDKIASSVINNIEIENHSKHHSNIRTFLYNKISLISISYYRAKQRGYDIENMDSFVKSLEKRNKFLNGRLYLDTKNEWTALNNESGLECMNIFFYDPDSLRDNSDHIRWPLLCKTRLLQMLDRNSRIYKDELLDFTSKYFNYPVCLIEKSLDDLRAFGMIDSGYNTGIYYVISDKGREYLTDSFTCHDSLYYFGLDSPMPRSFLDKGLVIPHNNKFWHSSNYLSASIITSTSFLYFLNYINTVERSYFNDIMNNSDSANGIIFGEVDLPFHTEKNLDMIIKAGEKRLNYISNEELPVVKSYVDSMFEVINSSSK